MPLFIAGLFKDRGLAERIITDLMDAGVPSSEISLVVREEAEQDVSDRDALLEEESPFASLAVHSAWERLGWQGGARPAYRDRIPPNIETAFIAAGPVAIAIGGAQLGACSGGLIGSMTNFGFTHDTAQQWYQRILGEGRAWVMVRTQTADAGRVNDVFDRFQPDARAESLRRW